MKNNKGSAIVFLIIVLVVIFFATLASRLFKSSSADLVGTTAPPIQINEWITSQPPDLNGRVYVLEFWATWCPPCVQSIPHMIKLANKYEDKGVFFVAVSVDSSSEPVKKMVKSKSINYHVGMNNGLAEKYSVRSIPSTFIIDRSGRIVWQGHPMKPNFESAIANAINTLPPVSGAK